MRSAKKILFLLFKFMFLLNFCNSFYLAETKNSIIKIFCVNNFKEEMLKADIVFNEKIANETCECYLEQFVQTSSHQNAIKKCKLEAQKKIIYN